MESKTNFNADDTLKLCQNLDKYVLPATQPYGFCNNWFYDDDLWSTRGLFVTNEGNVLVVDRAKRPAEIISLVDEDLDGTADTKYVIATHYDLDHGISIFGNKLYASSGNELYRWTYTEGQITISTDVEVVVTNMPSGGHHTRSLVFDNSGYLYLQVGSGSNVDTDFISVFNRSIVRRFHVASFGVTPIDYNTGEVVAYGIRNEVGISFDRLGQLWGVENSADNLNRNDLGGDIHNDNPSEELNYFPLLKDSNDKLISHNYGYPYCFTEFKLSKGLGRGTIWAWPEFMNDGIHSDSWCRNNTISPMLSLQPHTAPLSITFFDATKSLDPSCPPIGSFPDSYDGHAFVALHGSWNRQPPIGYKIIRIPMSSDGKPLYRDDLPLDFFFNGESTCAKWSSGWKPVEVKFDRCNRLLVSSDTIGGVLLISYNFPRNQTFDDIIQSIDDESCISKVNTSKLVLIIVSVIVGLVLIIIVIYFLCKRYNKNKDNEIKISYNNSSNNKNNKKKKVKRSIELTKSTHGDESNLLGQTDEENDTSILLEI